MPGLVVRVQVEAGPGGGRRRRDRGAGGHEDGERAPRAGGRGQVKSVQVPAGRGGRKGPGPGGVRVARAPCGGARSAGRRPQSGARQPARRAGLPAAVLPRQSIAPIPCSTCRTGRTSSIPSTSFAGEWGVGRIRWTPRPAGDWRRSSSACPTWAPSDWTSTARSTIADAGGGGRGAAYAAFLAGTLKPLVDERFRTRPSRDATVIVGIVDGRARSACYALFRHPDVFGAAGALSPSLWFAGGAIFAEVERAPLVPARIYLDIGTLGRRRARGQRAPDAGSPAGQGLPSRPRPAVARVPLRAARRALLGPAVRPGAALAPSAHREHRERRTPRAGTARRSTATCTCWSSATPARGCWCFPPAGQPATSGPTGGCTRCWASTSTAAGSSCSAWTRCTARAGTASTSIPARGPGGTCSTTATCHDEVLPFTASRNPNPFVDRHRGELRRVPRRLLRLPASATGCNRIIGMSGLYDIKRLTGGYSDANVYACNPSDFMPPRARPGAARGASGGRTSSWPSAGTTRPARTTARLSAALWDKGIGNALRIWDGWAHDWPYWERMIRLYIGGHD